jgi:hypothetical protein
MPGIKAKAPRASKMIYTNTAYDDVPESYMEMRVIIVKERLAANSFQHHSGVVLGLPKQHPYI